MCAWSCSWYAHNTLGVRGLTDQCNPCCSLAGFIREPNGVYASIALLTGIGVLLAYGGQRTVLARLRISDQEENVKKVKIRVSNDLSPPLGHQSLGKSVQVETVLSERPRIEVDQSRRRRMQRFGSFLRLMCDGLMLTRSRLPGHSRHSVCDDSPFDTA